MPEQSPEEVLECFTGLLEETMTKLGYCNGAECGCNLDLKTCAIFVGHLEQHVNDLESARPTGDWAKYAHMGMRTVIMYAKAFLEAADGHGNASTH